MAKIEIDVEHMTIGADGTLKPWEFNEVLRTRLEILVSRPVRIVDEDAYFAIDIKDNISLAGMTQLAIDIDLEIDEYRREKLAAMSARLRALKDDLKNLSVVDETDAQVVEGLCVELPILADLVEVLYAN